MNRDFQIRFTAGLLILLTTAAVVLAWINFQKEAEFQIPSDGVWWMEQAGNDGGLVANRVEPNGPGDKAGIRAGDRLTAINQHDVKDTTARMRQVYRVGAWSKATYSLLSLAKELFKDVSGKPKTRIAPTDGVAIPRMTTAPS